MGINKQQRYDQWYMDIAIRTAAMSYANRNKVGCVVVKNGQIISTGWNGAPSNFPNQCEDKDNKTLPYVLHSELNALAKLARSTESSDGATIYITLGTCVECAKLIIQSGIKRVVYLEEYRDDSGIELLKKTDILVEKFNFI